MSRDYKLYLKDILAAADNIARYVEGLNRNNFDQDEMRFHAILYNIQLLGEAAKNIPPEVRDLYPQIPWRGAAGLRDILIHKYFQLDLDLLWEAVHEKVPALRAQIAPLVE